MIDQIGGVGGDAGEGQVVDAVRERLFGRQAQGQLQGYSVVAEVFPNMSDARRLAQAAWEQIFTLGQAPVSIMTDVSANIEAAQKPAA